MLSQRLSEGRNHAEPQRSTRCMKSLIWKVQSRFHSTDRQMRDCLGPEVGEGKLEGAGRSGAFLHGDRNIFVKLILGIRAHCYEYLKSH